MNYSSPASSSQPVWRWR